MLLFLCSGRRVLHDSSAGSYLLRFGLKTDAPRYSFLLLGKNDQNEQNVIRTERKGGVVMQFQESEIAAMANGAGGTIYVGVNDDGTGEGIEAPDSMIQRIANGIRDWIKPDVTRFLHYETQTASGKNILAISIQPGMNKPYYLAGGKGHAPGGCICTARNFIRAGLQCGHPQDDQGDGERALRRHALTEPGADFCGGRKRFPKGSLAFGLSQMRSLGMMGADGLYTNLALL